MRAQSKPAGNSLIVGFTDGVKEQWTTQAKPYLANLGKKIPNGIGGTIQLRKSMTSHGEAIILGVNDGMHNVWEQDVTPFVKDIAPWIAKNKGPLSTDATLLVPHGKGIMEGFLKGLREGWKDVSKFILSANADVQGSVVASADPNADDTTSNANGQFHGKFDSLINKYAKQFHVDPLLVASVIKQESNFNPKAISPAGAEGLGQLMPATARGLGVKDPFDPEQNIRGTAKYLSQLSDMFGGNIRKTVAAYNAGPGAVKHAGGVPHFGETENYVEKVTKNLASYTKKFGEDSNTLHGFSLTKTVGIAAKAFLDGANRFSMGPVAAIGQQIGLAVSHNGGIHGKHAKNSWHYKGLGLDMAGAVSKMKEYAEYIRKTFKPSEIIYSPLGWSHGGGAWTNITDAAIKKDHYSHVHVGNPHILDFIDKLLKQKLSGRRALGGSVESGKSYLVGERGPEVVTFGNRGEVMSNDVMKRMLAQMSNKNTDAGSPMIGEVHIHSNASNPSAVALQTAAQLQGRLMRI